MADKDQRLLSIMRGLIRPLVRTLIARGVTAPAFYKMLKAVYVDVAYEEFRIGTEAPTDSRITLLTGVHRRDVRAILSDEDDSWETTRAKTAVFATVLGQWFARADYQDANGTPIALAKSADEGVSFEALVRDINTDIRPRTVLDELLRQGLVVENDEGLLVVSDAARKGPTSDEDRLVFFAANVGDHIAAASENLIAETPPFFERALFYNNMAPESVDVVEARARTLSQDVLETLNEESQALRTETLQDGPTERFRLGIYFYREKGERDPVAPEDDTDEHT